MSSEIIEQPNAVAAQRDCRRAIATRSIPNASGRDAVDGRWLKEFLQVPGRTFEQCLINNH